MPEKSELLHLPIFAGLPEDQLDWFIGRAEERVLKPDDTYLHQGDPADSMYVVLAGQLQSRGEIGGEVISFSAKSGDVTGVLPFSRMKQYPVTGKALSDARLLRFPASAFPELVQKMPELAGRVVALMSDRLREATRLEQQKDRLAGLGKLSAGLAHELNNPASAAKRATSQLRGLLKQIKEAAHELGTRDL